MWRTKLSRVAECLLSRHGLLLVLLPSVLLVTLYVASENNYDLEARYWSLRSYNAVEGTVEGYLVWNSKCRVPSQRPLDPSIAKFAKKEKYENCSKQPLLTRISRTSNGSVLLSLDVASTRKTASDVDCCWSAVVRSNFSKPEKEKFDSSIEVQRCESFENETLLPGRVEVAMVSCRLLSPGKSRDSSRKVLSSSGGRSNVTSKIFYENVHAIVNPEKVRERLENETIGRLGPLSRRLSVLVIGIDSVSRLNFLRSMPKTESYLRETDWIGLDGYNKMGDNTFPNLMAILTGQNQTQAYSRCEPTVPYKLDRCPFVWQKFREAGYVTAYGEDETSLNTFNYLKVGFVQPPTDYYLRPYMLACEKLLKIKKRFDLKYCTGPESNFERIFGYANEFAQTFLGQPYFGFFWTNSVSHNSANGVSSMDERALQSLRRLEHDGVLEDAMVVFLSDHGMRWGSIRNTVVGWYEEKLPFVYLRLPSWFRKEHPTAYPSLRLNRHRLASPFDLYETLREVLRLSSGLDAGPSLGCPECRSLLGPLPRERGCRDVGVSQHWCACADLEPADPTDPAVKNGALFFLEHVETIVRDYKNSKGKRLCAKLRLRKLLRAYRQIDFPEDAAEASESLDPVLAYFYVIQVSPGDGKFEVTVRRLRNGTYVVSDNEVSRLNRYGPSAKCLDHGNKQYCHCLE